MGNPMAKNIHKKGFKLGVYNRSSKRLEEFKKLNVQIFNSPQELAQDVDMIVSMVTGPKDVREVLLGPKGVIKGAKKGLIVIDMSTIGPSAAQKISSELRKFGVDFLDAPVTGSVPKAITGELTIFIGGDKKVFEKARPVLSAMGTNLQYMGKVGMGQAIKLINNHLVASELSALAEAMLLADIMGLSRSKVAKSLENVFAMSPLMKMKMPNMVANQFPVAFSMANMHKDEKISLDEVRKTKKNLPVLRLIERLYKKGLEMGLANFDNSAILEVLSKHEEKNYR